MSDLSSRSQVAHEPGTDDQLVSSLHAPASAPIATDPDLPLVGTLLGAEVADLLGAALAPSGGRLLTAHPHDIAWWPGRSITVAYTAQVAWRDGVDSVETLVASAGDRIPDGALVLSGDLGEVALWRAPQDPGLPGLAPALDPHTLTALLSDLGVRVDPAGVSTRIRSYRPGRRAVIDVTAPGTRVFLKVVRPHRAEAIHERHRQLRAHLPVPESLGWSSHHGVVALEALPGDTMRDLFATGAPPPGPSAVLALLDELPAPLDGATSWGWRASELGGVVAAASPELAGRVGELAARLDSAEAALDPTRHRAVPVHGDLHDAQLLVQDGAVSGLLDVDTHAIGRRVDDLATMIGHLSTLATAVPHGDAVLAHAQRLLERFDREVDPVDLRRAVAAVVLGLATGPFRVLEPGWQQSTEARVELAEQWLASADALAGSGDEGTLTSASDVPQTRPRR